MIIIVGLVIILAVFLVTLYNDYTFTKQQVIKNFEKKDYEFLSMNMSFESDSRNPFLKRSTGIRPSVLINGRPGGDRYRFFIVEYRNGDGEKISSYVEMKSKFFGSRSLQFEENIL